MRSRQPRHVSRWRDGVLAATCRPDVAPQRSTAAAGLLHRLRGGPAAMFADEAVDVADPLDEHHDLDDDGLDAEYDGPIADEHGEENGDENGVLDELMGEEDALLHDAMLLPDFEADSLADSEPEEADHTYHHPNGTISNFADTATRADRVELSRTQASVRGLAQAAQAAFESAEITARAVRAAARRVAPPPRAARAPPTLRPAPP